MLHNLQAIPNHKLEDLRVKCQKIHPWMRCMKSRQLFFRLKLKATTGVRGSRASHQGSRLPKK